MRILIESEGIGSEVSMSCDGNAEWMAFVLLETLNHVCNTNKMSLRTVLTAYIMTGGK